jgi:hypothetical protein
MTYSTIRGQLYLILLATALLLQLTHAQVGTITQDIYDISAFPSQKPCAQSCFVLTGFCPNDVLGGIIGCKSHSNCDDSNWQATNDCYCRTDLQQPAQNYLTSCVESQCTVGDSRIDASSAGSIYAQYCAGKGYSIVAPATVQATATGPGGSTGTVGGVGSGPTASSTSNSQGSLSGSSKLSTTTIIGIAVGGLAGLVFLVVMIKEMFKWLGGGRNSKAPTQYQHPINQPVYPIGPYSEPKAWESDVTPDDSVSMVSAFPRPAPTMVSNIPSYPPHRY